MYSFDPNKIWYSAEKKSFMMLSTNDIQLLAEKVSTQSGGILKKGQMILLSSAFKSFYNIVVIKHHPCALIRKLGSGAYGTVYEAYDLKRQKKVAVKSQPVFLAEVITKQAAVTKMNGIGLTDVGSNIGPSFLADKNGYFILPLADSCFHNWISQKTVSGQENLVIKALIKIGQDLQALHSQNKVHMDLKTDNVLIINDEAFLSDFGKVEKDGTIIPSAHDEYFKYPQCAPEYFIGVSKNPFYTVCYTFDLYSYGYLLKMVSKMIKDPKYKAELSAIATYTHRMKSCERKQLTDVIAYLKKV